MMNIFTNLIFGVSLLTPAAMFALRVKDSDVQLNVAGSLILSLLSGYGAWKLIPHIAKYLLKADMFGKDLNKPGDKESKPPVPESLGVVCATLFMICVIIQQLLYLTTSMKAMLIEYNAAMCSVCFMIFLGFSDDVLDLPWRYKMILPTIASLPLLAAYSGGTSIVVPIPARFLFGKILDLGILYHVYMSMLAVFCTNAINIYAGINGLEAGQSFVIACAILTHNIVELSGPVAGQHLFSIVFILPFICVTLALLYYNWYPSRVFVGDTFCYFAGMTFAVTGILGHFSKTLLLFFIPQIINFVYSIPQLIGIVHCPRHRLPQLNVKTGKLEGIKTNMNLVNLSLLILGPQTEAQLCKILLAFQIICCGIGFAVRYHVASYFY